MLPKKKRFNLRYQENLDILRKSKRVFGEYFTLYFYFDQENSSPFRSDTLQVAVTVSKKIEKSAVKRNSLRRRAYAAVEKVLEEKNLWKKNVKIVLVAKKSFLDVTNPLLLEEFKKLIAQIPFIR